MTQNKKPLLNNLMRWFLFSMVLANISWMMTSVVMPLYLTELGASIGQVGLTFTLGSIISLALQIFGGYLSDSIGRLRAVAWGSIAGTLSYGVIAISPSWEWVIFGLSLGSAASALVRPSFGAFIAEQSSAENRGRTYGISEAIFMIVAVVGAPLGGFLSARLGFRAMLFTATALYASAAVLRFWMARSVRDTTEANPQRISLHSLRVSLKSIFAIVVSGGLLTWVLLADGVRDVALRTSEGLYPLYLQEVGGMSLLQVGLLGSVFGIAMMIITVPAGLLADKRGERIAIASGFAILAIALLVLVSVQGFFGFAIAQYLFGTGMGMMSPAFSSLTSKAVPEKMRGVAFGLLHTSVGLISLPAPWIAAQLWERFDPGLPFIIAAFIAMVAIIPVWLKLKLPTHIQQPEA